MTNSRTIAGVERQIAAAPTIVNVGGRDRVRGITIAPKSIHALTLANALPGTTNLTREHMDHATLALVRSEGCDGVTLLDTTGRNALTIERV